MTPVPNIWQEARHASGHSRAPPDWPELPYLSSLDPQGRMAFLFPFHWWDVDSGVVALRPQIPLHTQLCKCCEHPSSKNGLLLNICQVFHCMPGCFRQIYFQDILLSRERSSDPAWLCRYCQMPGTSLLAWTFLLFLWKMQQVPSWQHHCSPASVKGELFVVSKSQGKEKGEATTFQREQQQGFRFQHWEKLSAQLGRWQQQRWCSWPVPTKRWPLGWLPGMSAGEREREWGNRRLEEIKKQNTQSSPSLGAQIQNIWVISLLFRYRNTMPESKKPQWCCPSSVSEVWPDHIHHDRCIPDFLLHYFNKEDFNDLIMQTTFPQLIHLVILHIPLIKSIGKHHIYWHSSMDFPPTLRNISKIWPLSNL